MIAFVKNEKLYNHYSFIVDRGANYLGNKTIENDYEKAIAAYALSLTLNEEIASKLINELSWDFLNLNLDQVKPIDIETASYSILACLKLNREPKALEVFQWLMKQRRIGGKFTVLALEAISAMGEKFNNQNVNIQVNFSRRIAKIQSSSDTKYFQLPSNETNWRVSAKGEGFAYVNVIAEYRTKVNEQKVFNIEMKTSEIQDGVKLMLKIHSEIEKSNMVVVEIEMPSGYEYNKHDLSDDVKVRNLILSKI